MAETPLWSGRTVALSRSSPRQVCAALVRRQGLRQAPPQRSSFGDVIARVTLRGGFSLRTATAPSKWQGSSKHLPSTFGQRVGTALRQPLTSPTGMGLATAALTGLEMAGPQPVPTSTGQILARAGMAGLQAFGKATEAEQARKVAQQRLDLDRQRLEIERARAIAAASPDKTTLEKNLLAAGYKPGTPEYESAVRAYLAKSTAPTVTVDMGAGSNEFKKASIEYAFKRIGNEDKAIASMSVLENELDTIQNLIEGGADTGRIAEALIPIQQILAEAGLIGDEEMDDLADRELLQRSNL